MFINVLLILKMCWLSLLIIYKTIHLLCFQTAINLMLNAEIKVLVFLKFVFKRRTAICTKQLNT